jgi:transcriptional regulator with XRE-family HTH domain
MLFEKKKLKIETLSEYLGEIRAELGLSLEDVAEQIGIKPKFLEDLEEGKFLKLPPDVYVLGFLKQIGRRYNIESEVLIEQYKKERGIQKQLLERAKEEGRWKKKIKDRVVITPKSVSIFAGLVFVVATLGYIIWQVSSINKTPSLEIIEPQDRQIIKGSSVSIKGKTDPGMSVTVNEQNIFVDSQGNFKTQLGITAGPRDLTIAARNKFDKSITKIVSIVGEDEQGQPQAGQLQLKLEFSDTITLGFIIDDSAEQSAVFRSGDVKQFSAKNKILLSTTNAGATKVTLNGEVLGPMGRSNEKLEHIPFFAESGTINNGDK